MNNYNDILLQINSLIENKNYGAIEKYVQIIKSNLDYAFRYVMRKWSFGYSKMVIQFIKNRQQYANQYKFTDDYAFRYACENGHLDTAKWLYRLSKTDNNTRISINAQMIMLFDMHVKMVIWKQQNGYTVYQKQTIIRESV